MGEGRPTTGRVRLADRGPAPHMNVPLKVRKIKCIKLTYIFIHLNKNELSYSFSILPYFSYSLQSKCCI